jgi:hypothetical protein
MNERAPTRKKQNTYVPKIKPHEKKKQKQTHRDKRKQIRRGREREVGRERERSKKVKRK